MARDPEIERKLLQWAAWRERQGTGSGVLGFARTDLEPRAAGGYREAPIPVDDFEAAVTDQGVLALSSPMRAAVEAYYLRAGSVDQAARRLCLGVRMLQVRVGQAHAELGRWFADRRKAADEQRARVERLTKAASPGGGVLGNSRFG